MNEKSARTHLEEMYEEAGMIIPGTEDAAKKEWVEFHIKQIFSIGGGTWNNNVAVSYLDDLEHAHHNSAPLI